MTLSWWRSNGGSFTMEQEIASSSLHKVKTAQNSLSHVYTPPSRLTKFTSNVVRKSIMPLWWFMTCTSIDFIGRCCCGYVLFAVKQSYCNMSVHCPILPKVTHMFDPNPGHNISTCLLAGVAIVLPTGNRR